MMNTAFRKLFWMVLGLGSINIVHAQSPIKEKDSLAITTILDAQKAAWNRGDIPSFMESYWPSEQLVFSGSGGPVYGWVATKMRYEKNYPTPQAMGRLEFTVLNLLQVDQKSVQMQGRYDLFRKSGESHGYFTLLWKKIKGEWLIISDHTSAAKTN